MAATSNGSQVSYEELRVGRHAVRVSIEGVEFDTVPLLMCHGVGAGPNLWGDFRSQLRRTTVALEVEGGHLGRRPTLQKYAHLLADVLAELDMARVDILGLSWGGMAAQEFTRDYPRHVRRLILAGTSTGFLGLPASPGSYRFLLTPSRKKDNLPQLAARFYAGDFVDDADLAERLGLVRPIDAGLYRRQLAACVGWTSVPWLRRINQPTLVMHGSDDPVCPYANARLLATLLPKGELMRFEKGGHLFLLSRPGESAAAVNEFLDR